MSVSIGGLFLAGVLPGVLIAGSMMVTVFVYAKLRSYPVDTRSTLGELARAFGQAFFALITPLIIVGGIVGGFCHTDGSLGHRGCLFAGHRRPPLPHLADQEYSQSAVRVGAFRLDLAVLHRNRLRLRLDSGVLQDSPTPSSR